MMVLKHDAVAIAKAEDVVRVRQLVRAWASDLKLSLVDQTKLVTATSELARNTLEHGGGGHMKIELVENGSRRGIRLSFTDQGPGIPDLNLALRDGYTTSGGMGLGLSGSKRLVNEFDIKSEVGRGTVVTVVRWK
jgi:serine/threonine-protein kinase RsbT